MTLNACPMDTVHAPVERVWALLMQPAGYGRFWEFTVEHVEPEGPAMVGQKFAGWTKPLCQRWRWRLAGVVQEVDAERHQILFHMSLPFGLTSKNRIMCSRIDQHSCTLRYGCDFTLPPGGRGWLWRCLPTSAIHKSVEESLQLLKRAAEGEVHPAEAGNQRKGMSSP